MKSTPLSRATAFSATILTLTLLLPIHAQAASIDALLISTIATGGSAAADEYVVVEAVGAGGANLADYELIYTTASGATTRRLVSFEGVAPLGPGARRLVANSLGAYAIGAFATWSEGIAATGGAVRLRVRATPTEVADAVAWGSAVAAAGGFGTPAPAMSSTTMIDRRRGADHSLVNTQSNSADFSLVPVAPPTLTPISPTPQPPTPTPSALPSPSPTPAPTPTPSPLPSPSPTPAPTPTPSPLPSPSPTPAPTPRLTPTPTPTTTPTPSPQPTATPSPTPHVLTSTEARATPVGTVITLRGTISAAPGELAEERLYCLEDPATGAGVFVLAQAGDTDLSRGDVVIITGTLQMRRQAVTLVATTTALPDGVEEPRVGRTVEPPALGPWAWEAWEGQTIQVAGTVRGSLGNLAGGSRSLTLRLSGGGDLLVGIAPSVFAQVEDQSLKAKMAIIVRGVLHQRAGSAGGGYRLWALAVTISRPATPGTPVVSPDSGPRPSFSPSSSAVLPIDTPSVATPAAVQPEWPERLARALEVRGGALVLIGPTSFSLVVLPRCDKAQAVPQEIRARGMVDRAGRAPYPQLR